MPPKTVMSVVVEQFPELTETEAKQLVMRAMTWLTMVGAMAAKQIDKALVNGTAEREAIIERRAQAIALGVLSKAIAIKFTSEEDQINAVADFFSAITEGANAA